jgi:hypothetical protein
MDYFALATQLARAEGSKTLAQIATKAVALRSIAEGTNAPCGCSAYDHPHTLGAEDCPAEPFAAFNAAYARYFA